MALVLQFYCCGKVVKPKQRIKKLHVFGASSSRGLESKTTIAVDIVAGRHGVRTVAENLYLVHQARRRES